MAEVEKSITVLAGASGAVAFEGPSHCLNCDTPRAGAYCYQCGQHFLEGRLTLRRFAREFVARFFNLEQGLLHTFLHLMVRPGEVARRYVEGHRREYANPLAYFLLAATIALIAFQFSEDILYEYLLNDVEQQFETLNEQAREDFSRAFGDDVAAGYVSFLLTNIKRAYTYLSLVLVVCFAFVLRWFFSGGPTNYNLAESLVFALFVVGQMTLLLAVVMPFLMSIDMRLYFAVIVLGYIALCAFAALGFYGRRWQNGLLSVAAFALGYALYIVFIMAVGIVGVIVFVVRNSTG